MASGGDGDRMGNFCVGDCFMREAPWESGRIDQGSMDIGKAGIGNGEQRLRSPARVQQSTKTATLV